MNTININSKQSFSGGGQNPTYLIKHVLLCTEHLFALVMLSMQFGGTETIQNNSKRKCKKVLIWTVLPANAPGTYLVQNKKGPRSQLDEPKKYEETSTVHARKCVLKVREVQFGEPSHWSCLVDQVLNLLSSPTHFTGWGGLSAAAPSFTRAGESLLHQLAEARDGCAERSRILPTS